MKAALLALLVHAAGLAGVRYTIPVAVFTYDRYPAEPREDYLDGNLGIVLPSYSRSYLYVAHRWMDGPPLTLEEQREMKKVWFRVRAAPENDASVWYDLRSTLDIPEPPAAPTGGVALSTRGYLQFRPCMPHAFQRAADRLREYMDRFGAASAEVREWVRAQDLVFRQCSLPGDGLFPSGAPENVHPVIQEDRRYQIAAARFIATHFEEAEQLFRQIEPNSESWAGLWAPYMVGRSILWQARTHLGDDERYHGLLRRAQVALEAVLRNDDLAETHDAARYLLIRILAITDQEAAARLLGLRLSSPLRAGSRVQDWEQYASLLYHNTRRRVDYRTEMRPHAELHKLGVRDRLTDWILTFQSQDPAAYAHALKRWKETRSTAWLVACLSKTDAAVADAAVLLEAAAATPEGPGWASVQFYSARVLETGGELERARSALDALLPAISDRSSSWNRALTLRAKLARSAEELLRYSIRRPASFAVRNSGGWRSDPWEWDRWDVRHLGRFLRPQPMLMPEAADVLNSAVPLDRFAALAMQDSGLPERVSRDIAIAAWVRSILLGDSELSYELASLVAGQAPEIAGDMTRYRASKPGDRPFIALEILLEYPGMSAKVHPGIGREAPLNEMHLAGFNWWWWTLRGEIEPSPPEVGPVDWIPPAERARAAREWERIVALGNGAAWLYDTVYERCKAGAPPAGCAKALHRVAVSSRWIDYHHGMQYLPYDVRSQSGYDVVLLLHRLFGGTRWAQVVERDQAADVDAWKHEYLPFRLSAPYPDP